MYYCKYCNSGFTTHNHKVMHENECPYKDAKPGYKVCSLCKRELKLTEFYVSRARYDNLNGRCKDCTKEYSRRCSFSICGVTPIGD